MLMIYIYENKKSVFSTIETKLLNFIQEEDLNKIAALYYDRDKLNLLYSRLVVLYGMYKLRGISPNDVNILKENTVNRILRIITFTLIYHILVKLFMLHFMNMVK